MCVCVYSKWMCAHACKSMLLDISEQLKSVPTFFSSDLFEVVDRRAKLVVGDQPDEQSTSMPAGACMT